MLYVPHPTNPIRGRNPSVDSSAAESKHQHQQPTSATNAANPLIVIWHWLALALAGVMPPSVRTREDVSKSGSRNR